MMSRTTTRATKIRRSLLKPARSDGETLPPLRSVLPLSLGVAALLYTLWSLLRGLLGDAPMPTPGTLAASLLPIALFLLPIVLISYAAEKAFERRKARMPETSHRIGRIGVRLGSGVLGSLVGYELLLLLSSGDLGIRPSVLGTVLTVNIAVALFVSIVGAAVSGRRVGRSLHRQQALLTDEFAAANKVQQGLLPTESPGIAGFDVSGGMTPAVEVGGDYYDYLTFADGTKGILVADAAGKGIPAALIMAKFQGMAQALSIHVADPHAFFVGLNDTLRLRLDRHSFITVAMVTIDLDDRCAYWRAGHNPLLHVRAADRTSVERRPPGMALGLTHGGMLGDVLEPERFALERNDLLLLYSDGAVEAVDAGGVPFGEARLAAVLEESAASGRSAEETRSHLQNALAAHVGDGDAHDDVTLVVIRRVLGEGSRE